MDGFELSKNLVTNVTWLNEKEARMPSRVRMSMTKLAPSGRFREVHTYP